MNSPKTNEDEYWFKNICLPSKMIIETPRWVYVEKTWAQMSPEDEVFEKVFLKVSLNVFLFHHEAFIERLEKHLASLPFPHKVREIHLNFCGNDMGKVTHSHILPSEGKPTTRGGGSEGKPTFTNFAVENGNLHQWFMNRWVAGLLPQASSIDKRWVDEKAK